MVAGVLYLIGVLIVVLMVPRLLLWLNKWN